MIWNDPVRFVGSVAVKVINSNPTNSAGAWKIARRCASKFTWTCLAEGPGLTVHTIRSSGVSGSVTSESSPRVACGPPRTIPVLSGTGRLTTGG